MYFTFLVKLLFEILALEFYDVFYLMSDEIIRKTELFKDYCAISLLYFKKLLDEIL